MPRVKKFDEQDILERAMQLFWEKGFSATSIQDLVTRLGVNRASLYDTYGGKDELFKKSFKFYRKNNTESLREFLSNQPDVKEGLKLLFDKAIDESINDPARKGCFVVNATTELVPGDKEMHAILLENKKTFEQIFYDYLKKGEAENQFKSGKDLKAIASLIFTLYNGFKVVSKVEPQKEEMSNTISLALSLLD